MERRANQRFWRVSDMCTRRLRFVHTFLVIWLSQVVIPVSEYYHTIHTIPKIGCPGYRQADETVVNVYFANCIRQSERKLQTPIYNQDLAVSNHWPSVKESHLFVSMSMQLQPKFVDEVITNHLATVWVSGELVYSQVTQCVYLLLCIFQFL